MACSMGLRDRRCIPSLIRKHLPAQALGDEEVFYPYYLHNGENRCSQVQSQGASDVGKPLQGPTTVLKIELMKMLRLELRDLEHIWSNLDDFDEVERWEIECEQREADLVI